MQAVSLQLIPNFLRARSPQGLRRLMLLNNTKDSTFYQYQEIQFAEGYWYCWYYKDVGADDIKVLEGTKPGGADV